MYNFFFSCNWSHHISFIIFLSSGDVSALHHTEEEAKAAARSLQAFVHYHHLYEHWWSNSAQIQSRFPLTAADSSPADNVNGGVSESEELVCPVTRRSEKLDFDASLLLFELHAAYQATQRSVREIQERLSAIMLQHSRAQGGRLDSAEEEVDGPTQISTTSESSDIQGSADDGQR